MMEPEKFDVYTDIDTRIRYVYDGQSWIPEYKATKDLKVFIDLWKNTDITEIQKVAVRFGGLTNSQI